MLRRKHVTDLLFDVQSASFEAPSITRYAGQTNIIVISYFIEIDDLAVLLKVTRFSGSIIACLLQQFKHDIITHATALFTTNMHK